MPAQMVFRRCEMKYLLNEQQYRTVLAAMKGKMIPDAFPHGEIRNLYYDTPDYRLIRRSLERPSYKEKLRIRSYKPAAGSDRVFVELKKKYDGIVYKRRETLPLDQTVLWLSGRIPCPEDTQIMREIDAFRRFYGTLQPTVALSYTRDAWCASDGSDLRITFDTDILCRTDQLLMSAPIGGTELIQDGQHLMEVKTSGGMPLWLVHTFSREKIRKTTFSKYGQGYELLLCPGFKGEQQYA